MSVTTEVLRRTPHTGSPDAPALYRQITDAIARQIEEGQLRVGSMLPPEIELAKQFGVSRHTVRAGIAALVRAGRLERHRGRGTFVTPPRIQQSLARFYSVAHELREQGATLHTQVLARGHLHADHALADPACDWLETAAPGAIGYLHRLRLMDGVPLLLEWITFPAALCPALLTAPAAGQDDPGAAPFYEVLAARVGVTVTTARETLRPVAVSGREARLLQVPTRTPVFLVERVSRAGDRPIEWRRALVRSDRYDYTVDLVNPTEESGGRWEGGR
jgi:GntR family transcriptional regulator